MCKNNCGFCGNPANENYCSKCYREHLRNKSQILNKQPEAEKEPTLESTVHPETEKLEKTEHTDKKAKTENEKCFLCKKMVGLLGFSCRCGNVFCSLHRQANLHNCHFDYKTFNKIQLERKSVKIIPDKLERM